jgi:hypothetical protein
MAAMDLRPRSATEIVDASFQLLRHHVVELTTLSVAASIPLLVVRLLGSALTPGDPTMPDPSRVLLTAPLGIVAWLLQVFAPLPVIVAVSQFYLGDPYDARAAVRLAMRRYWTTLAAIIIKGILFGIGLILLLVPGLYVWLRLAPVSAVSLLEDGDSGKTTSRSFALTADMTWHVFLVWLPLLAIYSGLLVLSWWMLMSGAALSIVKHTNEIAVFQTALSAFISPVIAVVTVALYYDLRTRKEGFDVEMMSRAMAPATGH